ncbi:MAG: response regulator, partial [Rhodospirillales bacterium]|nr:response regulator [Acetobacter sp.]
MWTPIRAVIVEDEPLAAQYLATLLDETWQVKVVGTAADAATALALCAELRPDAAFLDIRLPGQDGVSLATQLTMLPQPPRIVFTTGQADRAAAAFRLEAVDYLLKPLDPEQVNEAVKRLAALLRPFEVAPTAGGAVIDNVAAVPSSGLAGAPQGELLPVKDTDRDQIRLLTRSEIVAVLRRERRTWVHTVREEFATYYPVADLLRWL